VVIGAADIEDGAEGVGVYCACGLMGTFSSSQVGGQLRCFWYRAPMMLVMLYNMPERAPARPRWDPAWDRSWHDNPATTSHCVPSCKPAAVRCAEVIVVTSMGKVVKEWVMVLMGRR
jgi:hypothetical protein